MLSRYAVAWGRHEGVALTRSDMAGDREWYRCLEYDAVYRTLGIDHNVWCFRSIGKSGNEANGSFIGRAAGRPDFTGRQKAIVAEGYALLAPLVGGALARFAEPSPAALSPRLRQVLRCILEGDGDKQIAARLTISPHTVNQYVKAIFQHFGVQSRAELMARWVRRGWAGGFAWAEE
jgi:DNA-binding CsgD family transcriptional regulator